MNKSFKHPLVSKAEDYKVSELPAAMFMTKSVRTVNSTSSINSVIQMFKTHKISGAPVVDNNGRLIGVISEYDLLLQSATKDLNQPIDFTTGPITIKEDTPLKEVLLLLHKKRIKRLPVVHPVNGIVGIVSRIDVLKTLSDAMGKSHLHGI